MKILGMVNDFSSVCFFQEAIRQPKQPKPCCFVGGGAWDGLYVCRHRSFLIGLDDSTRRLISERRRPGRPRLGSRPTSAWRSLRGTCRAAAPTMEARGVPAPEPGAMGGGIARLGGGGRFGGPTGGPPGGGGVGAGSTGNTPPPSPAARSLLTQAGRHKPTELCASRVNTGAALSDAPSKAHHRCYGMV